MQLEANFMESVLSFHFDMNSKKQTQVIRLTEQALLPAEPYYWPHSQILI